MYKMKWGEITISQDGNVQLETTMKKTGKTIWVPLSDNALRWLPERGDASDDDRVFANLPDQASNADSRLKTLISHAGITKHVTFHVASHSISSFTLSTSDLQN